MRKLYKGVYGDSASITINRDGSAKLVVKTCYGKTVARKVYSTEHGARVAMGRMSDGWREVK